MPAPLLAAPVVANAGALAAVAAHHFSDEASSLHEVANTSFIQLPVLPISTGRLRHILLDKWHVLRDHLIGEPPVGPDQARMVEYYAAACPHCKHMEPAWKEAMHRWSDGPETDKVVWQQRECLDENWKPGKDFEECKAADIEGFPTIRFYPPGKIVGDDFFSERTPARLLDFAKMGIHPTPGNVPRLPGDLSDFKLVDFSAAACPHCKAFNPVFDDASKEWQQYTKEMEQVDEDTPLVSFERKECFDDHWENGKDSDSCQQLHVQSFPTLKLFKTDPNGHGFSSVDYKGPRTAESINDFIKEQAGLPKQVPKVEEAANAGGVAEQASGEADTVQAEKAAAAAVGSLAEQQPSPDQEPLATAPDAAAAAGTASAPAANEDAIAEEDQPSPAAMKVVSTAQVPLTLLAGSCLGSHRRSPRGSAARRAAPPRMASQFF